MVEEQRYHKKRISELAISFLCDESTNHPTDKIWWYMNS